jgi:hypothetical protein
LAVYITTSVLFSSGLAAGCVTWSGFFFFHYGVCNCGFFSFQWFEQRRFLTSFAKTTFCLNVGSSLPWQAKQ